MEISVICPVFNEEENIQGLIDFFNEALPKEKELILIDGGSLDQTVSIIKNNQLKNSNIILLHNKHKIVPYALNMAIPICKGKYIVRIDGHSEYAINYFESILKVFSRVEADIVGGPTRTKFKTPRQEGIAYCISHPFGIGGSLVHNPEYEGDSDSVTFGAWKREIFEKTGYFDERLVRNQDDEFHYRAKSKGLRIYQDPSIKLYYFPRNTFKGLFKQYFQYGLYKPLVLRKIKSGIQLRHLVPSAFVIYLLLLVLPILGYIRFIPLVLYIAIITFVTFINNKKMVVKFNILVALLLIHIAYGVGFMVGVFKLLRR